MISALKPNPAIPRIAAVLLAAGSSKRMRGRDKLLRKIGDVPLLRRSALTAINSWCWETVLVLDVGGTEKFRCVSDLPLRVVFAAKSKTGLSMSLRSGIAAISQPVDGALILLADMPEIEFFDINALVSSFSYGKIVAAGSDGEIGNPVVLPQVMFADLADLIGDNGAKQLIRAHSNKLVVVNLLGTRAKLDLDTPEEWSDWTTKNSCLQSSRRELPI